jgi:hypothetical protein
MSSTPASNKQQNTDTIQDMAIVMSFFVHKNFIVHQLKALNLSNLLTVEMHLYPKIRTNCDFVGVWRAKPNYLLSDYFINDQKPQKYLCIDISQYFLPSHYVYPMAYPIISHQTYKLLP